MCSTPLEILLYQVLVIRPMILLQTPYGTKYIIVNNSLQTEMALMEATAIKSGQQPKQGLVGLPKMKETTVAVGRGIAMFLITMMVICFIQMQKLQAFFVLEVHASTASKSNSPVTEAWILEHVVPCIASSTYGVAIAKLLGKSLLWAIFSDKSNWVPQFIVDCAKAVCNNLFDEETAVNPIEKQLLVLPGDDAVLTMAPIPNALNPRPPPPPPPAPKCTCTTP